MNRIKRQMIAAWVLAATASLNAGADDMLSAADAMCQKIRACSMAQVAEAEMTDEMRQMMEPMLDSMCEQMRQGVGQVPAGHTLYDPAVACMRSLASLSCTDLQDENASDTQQCKQYRQLAEKVNAGG